MFWGTSCSLMLLRYLPISCIAYSSHNCSEALFSNTCYPCKIFSIHSRYFPDPVSTTQLKHNILTSTFVFVIIKTLHKDVVHNFTMGSTIFIKIKKRSKIMYEMLSLYSVSWFMNSYIKPFTCELLTLLMWSICLCLEDSLWFTHMTLGLEMDERFMESRVTLHGNYGAKTRVIKDIMKDKVIDLIEGHIGSKMWSSMQSSNIRYSGYAP